MDVLSIDGRNIRLFQSIERLVRDAISGVLRIHNFRDKLVSPSVGRLGALQEQLGAAHGVVNSPIETVVELEVLRQQTEHEILINGGSFLQVNPASSAVEHIVEGAASQAARSALRTDAASKLPA
jgi:hypothetical protein